MTRIPSSGLPGRTTTPEAERVASFPVPMDLPPLRDLGAADGLLFPRLRTLVVQPGLSAARCTDEQLRLLAGAETYVRAVSKGTFEVHGSD